ncbi:MAG TPA: hypothetical protein DEQ02_01495, partial [Ruminococcaceae bacterium]|nr:hypothetical protein [Oscillospiraceae bacterium]
MLYESSASVSSLAKQYLPLSLDSRTRLSQVLLTISQTIEGDIYIVDTSGQTVLCSDNANMRPCRHRARLISDRIMALATTGTYDETGTLDGMFETNYYTVAVPMYYRDGSVAGAVFASTSSGALTDYVFELFRMFILSAVLVLFFVIAVAYMLTARLTKPLRMMADAARRMSRGDFSKRVTIGENDELSELASAFNNMASSLAMLEQMRRSFIANVSHELKTPMTT